jgi:hypothetical protein
MHADIAIMVDRSARVDEGIRADARIYLNDRTGHHLSTFAQHGTR